MKIDPLMAYKIEDCFKDPVKIKFKTIDPDIGGLAMWCKENDILFDWMRSAAYNYICGIILEREDAAIALLKFELL